MARLTTTHTRKLAAAAFIPWLALSLGACSDKKDDHELSKGGETGIPDVPAPPADGPKLGALAYVTPVYDRPSTEGTTLGALKAGATVARAEEPYTKNGCEGGWYPIHPRGWICVGERATTDLSHPTMVAMAQQPKLDQQRPYVYARARKTTNIYERDPDKANAVRPKGKLRGRSGLAIVGSWNAMDEEGNMQRLAMMTNGHFVKAADLKKSTEEPFQGVELGDKHQLPVGFIVKRGVRAWHVEKGEAEKRKKLEYHEFLAFTGRFRTVGKTRYWATNDERYIRHQDVTTVRQRSKLWPSFAIADQKWIDVSIVAGTLVAYEGRKPVYATLCSVGRNRLDEEGEFVTKRGEFKVVAKHITATQMDPSKVAQYYDIYDTPWVLELENGQAVHGAFWHNRFGIERSNGNVHVAPIDANWLFKWATPSIPEGWNTVRGTAPEEQVTYVVVRK